MSRLADPETVEALPTRAREPLPHNAVRLLAGLFALTALLALLTLSVGLGVAAWAAGLGSAAALTTLVALGAARGQQHTLGPAVGCWPARSLHSPSSCWSANR